MSAAQPKVHSQPSALVVTGRPLAWLSTHGSQAALESFPP